MSMPATQAVSAKRIRWKAGKEDELWNYVQNRTAAGVSISEALKTFADQNGISWLTARWKYYRLRQDRAVTIEELEEATEAAQETREHNTIQPTMKPDEAFEALSRFLSAASKLECTDLTGLLYGLASMANAALKGEDAQRETAAIRAQYNELQKRMQEYERWLLQVRQEYETLRNTAEHWLSLHSVDRVTTMGEFAKKLQVQVEQLNRVLALAEKVVGEREAG